MNSKQYNNVIDYTLKHEQTEDSLATARAVFNNMGVALPQGDLSQVKEALETNNYMGWQSCTMEEAQAAADSGTAAIGISDERIVVLSANDEEQPVAETASVMSISENTSALAVSDLQYYSYNNASTQMNMYFENSSLAVDVGWSGYNTLYGAITSTIYWTSSNPSVASVGYYSGYITTNKAGSSVITAIDSGNGNRCAIFSIWVRGKTPVFLIHGRTSNSKTVWGTQNSISVNQNNHFNSDINATSLNGKKYTDVATQRITGFVDNPGGTENPVYLGNELKDAGYTENVNLFVFNYPNEDAVVYSAEKLEKYINNLIDYVRTSGTDEMKACFYASWTDYDDKKHRINLVGHSMGGLVARYYIENMGYMISYDVGNSVCFERIGYDKHVDKLITICTPHWGSGYAELSGATGIEHKLSDHDLDFNSAMYSGSNSTTVNCDKGTCPESNYIVTPALQYQRQRLTKYYAIAGIDYDAAYVNLNDHTFEMPTNFTTMQQITDYLFSKNVYKVGGKDLHIDYPPNPNAIGDNMVGFLSQIGWIGDNNNVNTPEPRIQMEKIFVDVDTNGGNGGETFVWEAIMEGLFDDVLLHSKIPHRTPVLEKTIEILGE